MPNKFKMFLTWHNCATYPPEELYNNRLIATDGIRVFEVAYHKELGWKRKDHNMFLPQQHLNKYYWADLEHTIRDYQEFRL